MTAPPVAIVTGGAGGIGLATARALGVDHHVVLASTNRRKLDDAASLLRAEGHSVESIACDIADRSSVESVFVRAAARGPVRAVVHSAGVSPQMGSGEQLLEVNARGTANVGETALQNLGDGAAVVLVASLAAYTFPDLVMPTRTYRTALTDVDAFTRRLKALHRVVPEPLRPGIAYAVGKHFTRWYAAERAGAFGAVGARILSVSPGAFDTDMGHLERRTGSGVIVANSALKRYGRPEEVAALIAYCVSPRARYLTGTDILCDGGARAGQTVGVTLQLARRIWSDR
ncbi:NAD(P)-dependent dehydrogenase (short-subunit alcohol dehydrogenase family) [Marmoricola sp. OAE513]|uniref:SDR family oxidoreductase n=1 Tax=Marmoricola sp. OAE513 TaxID=2817894 RepID=UPI001AE6B8C0